MSKLMSWLEPTSTNASDERDDDSDDNVRRDSFGMRLTPSPEMRRRSNSNQYAAERARRRHKKRADEWQSSSQGALLHSIDMPALDAGQYMRRFKIDRRGRLVNLGDAIVKHLPLSHCDHTFTVSILGSPGSGKSSLINQFRTSTQVAVLFSERLSSDSATTSITVPVILHDAIILMNVVEDTFTLYEDDKLWLADGETARSDCYVIVYSVASTHSFQYARKLYQALLKDTRTQNRPVILVGNKVDLVRKNVVPDEIVRKAFGPVLDNGAYYTVSVAIDHNVDELLVGLVCECLRIENDATVHEDEDDIDNETNDILVNSHGHYEPMTPQQQVEVESSLHDAGETPDEAMIDALRRFQTRRQRQRQEAQMGILRRVSTRFEMLLQQVYSIEIKQM